jgi:hypothetical protein
MSVLDTLDALERSVRESPWIPFTQLKAMKQEEIDQLLQATRQELERVRREHPPVPSRDEVLNQAANERKLILEAARQEANELLREDRIELLSRRRFDEVIGAGRQRGNSLVRDAYAYAVERMSQMERELSRLNGQVSDGVGLVQRTVKEAEKSQRQRGKQVARAQAKERRRKLRQFFFG